MNGPSTRSCTRPSCRAYWHVETSRRQRFHLGRWLSRQRTNRGRLTPYEILALT
ncbi:hypothetical protein [Streptomyces sp. NRRL F-525]|uniref:hypothetical protein n=1 Tax=Streptomyces sp. NRRL F-525 TaxID=1463861 RepID=UPI00131B1A63|nr:hypothetical protein [Streptomyces sp. NRRL F-525]